MATIKDLKRRIKAAGNITKITKAMEMVAASKMRRAQEKAVASRPFALKLDQVLKRMSALVDPQEHLFLQERTAQDTNTIAVLVVSPDKGLCGSLNSNLFKKLENFETFLGDKHPDIPIQIEYIAVGKKAREYVLKTSKTLHAEFISIPDRPAYEDIIPISQLLLDGFRSSRFFKVYLLHTDFINTMTQTPAQQKLLPIDTEDLMETASQDSPDQQASTEYLFEPSSQKILDWLLPYYFELQVYQKILEAQASEHSARMVAMRNASENAEEIVSYLRLQYNRKRQAAVTNQIAEIVTARMAIS